MIEFSRNGFQRTALSATLAALLPMTASAASILGWNTDNVDVGAEPLPEETGASVVYDRALNPDNSVPAGAISNGQIVFTAPEAGPPGIKVLNTPYPDSGPGDLELSGCIMASSAAACDSGFQSGKRIKQQMTGFGPMDLVFDVQQDDMTSVYQVFGRLINVTGQALKGFTIELGFGVGDDFIAADLNSGLAFSTEFTAQPQNSGSSNTQFPFGLFGDASTNPNFLLDGFFANDRTGFEVDQQLTSISSAGYYGEYASIFGPWMSQEAVPQGLFWDFDDDDTTDDLLMAWERSPGVWELRRDAGETCDPEDAGNCTPGVTRDEYVVGSLEFIAGLLGVDPELLSTGGIEDLANLNLNYAIELQDVFAASSFTLRASVAPVPVPPAAPLIACGMGLLAYVRRCSDRKRSRSVST